MSVVALVIAVVAAMFAGLAWWNAKKTTLHHILEDIRKDYRSPEMYHAVKTLWQFYRECEDNHENFVEKYDELRKIDENRISGLEERQRVEAEQTTLHYQRRLVSHFYQYVAALRANGVLPKGIVYKTWTEENLRIIPNIIIPIEIIGLFIKPFALTMRLFANMLGGHAVVAAFLGLIATPLIAPLSIAGAVAISMLEIFVAFLQAYIFVILSAVFIGMSMHPSH